MTNQAIPVTSLSGPPVSRWLGFFPEFRDDSLGFLLRCHAYGDVVKLPMGRMAEFLFRHPDLAMYFLNHPDDVKHVLVTNQHNYTKTRGKEMGSLLDFASHHHLPVLRREGWGRCLTLHFDNNLPSAFASALLRPQPLQRSE